jgi:hypothetical protein
MMSSARTATQAAFLVMMACALLACAVDRSGLETDAGPPPTAGRSDVSQDVPGPDAADAGSLPVTPDSAVRHDGDDSADKSDGAGGTDSDSADDGNSGDAGATDLASMLDASAEGSDLGVADAVAADAGPPASLVGCADGAREGLIDLASYPAIAACAGGWQVPGLISNAARTPACARAGGNQGARPQGQGCSAADLCAAGWHVCESASEVTNKGGRCADAVAPANGRKVFYAARQSGDDGCANSNSEVGNNGDNLVHGCGTFGVTASRGCAPLDTSLHDDNCTANPPWQCRRGNNAHEISLVTKPGSALGGVLCCRD